MVRSLNSMKLPKLIAIVGPTASGKSRLALELAKQIKGEIVSCDSVQVYKGFDIGSAKASLKEQGEIPHHLINVVTWRESFDAARYRELALKAIEEIQRRSHTPILVGGTGLYFRALCGEKFHDLPSDSVLRQELSAWTSEVLYSKLQELDPLRAKELHPNDRFRVIRACEIAMLTGKSLSSLSQDSTIAPSHPYTILCKPSRESLLRAIAQRSKHMLENGLIEEVSSLLKEGCPQSARPMQSIGYSQVCKFFNELIKEEHLLEAIIVATRQYARKQLMWFRKVPIDKVIEDSQILEGNLLKHLTSNE